MKDLNFDVVEEQLRDIDGDIILSYRNLDYDTDILPEFNEPAVAFARNVDFPLDYVGIVAYERFLKKSRDNITQQDLDNIDVDKFYDFLVDFYEDEAVEYAYNHDLFEYDYDYYGSNDNG